MQPIFQSLLARPSSDEFSHDLQLIFTTSLKPTGVVENITIVSFKNEFVIDIMVATLQSQLSVTSAVADSPTRYAQPTPIEGSSWT